MKKLIVAVFDTSAEAFNSAVAINNLHSEGDVTVFGSIVLEKDHEGLIQVKQSKDKGGNSWALGFLGGSLLGAFAGAPGLALGASIGGLTGLCFDANRAGIDVSFIEEVSTAIEPGMTALVIDLDENWITPIDVCVEKNSGIIFRRNRADVVEDQLQRESEALARERVELKLEMENATGEAKDSIQKHLDKLTKKAQQTKDIITTRVDDIHSESFLKADILKSQLTTASGKGKVKIEQRLSKLQKSLNKSKRKLQSSLNFL